MDIVIDTSAVLAVLLREPSRPAVLKVTAGVRLAAPPSLHWEVGNALGAMFKRKSIALDDAVQVARDFSALPILYRPTSLETAVRLAFKLNIYAYDADMIACAREYGLPLLTLDRGLRDEAGREGLVLLEATA